MERRGKTQAIETRNGKDGAADVFFEGVLIPKDTRSARLANQGITNEEEMGNFLTAVFADTLKGKIILPKTDAGVSPILNGLEEKLKLGLPVGIRAMGGTKVPGRSKVKKS